MATDEIDNLDDNFDEEPEKRLCDLYDTTPECGENGLYGFSLNDGLTAQEIELAKIYSPLSRGMMIVCGEPGMGKTVFAAHLAWQIRRMFKGKKALLDWRPRPLFDLGSESNRYVMFDDYFLLSEMDKMAKEAGVKITDKDNDKDEARKEVTKEVAKHLISKNKVLLQNGVWEMDEFKRYMYNRRPTAKINMTTGMIISMWRHLDLLILGMCPNMDEIDYNACQYYLTHIIKMSAASDGHRYFADYYKKQHVTTKGVVNIEGKTQRIVVDGAKPLAEVGVELLDYNKAHGNIEKEIVSYLREKYKKDIRRQKVTRRMFDQYKIDLNSGVITATDFIHKYRELNVGELTIGMSNLNIIHNNLGGDLDELNERLLFMHSLGVIRCKRFFDIYNSKNFNDPRFQ